MQLVHIVTLSTALKAWCDAIDEREDKDDNEVDEHINDGG